ncbi:MAG: cytochrome c [Geminicoccaceae bacterium]
MIRSQTQSRRESRRMIRKNLMLVAGLAVVVTAGAALAQDIIATRQDEMKAFGKHMGAIKAVLIDKQGSMDTVVENADEIAGDAYNELVSWFPKGSDTGKTHALPAIWEKPDEFAADAKKTGDLATALSTAAKAGDAAAATAAFAALGKEGCGGCHATFRAPMN